MSTPPRTPTFDTSALERASITRAHMLAAMELASDTGLTEPLRESWFAAVPLDATTRFGVLLSADGKRRRWLADAGADGYVRPLTAWLREGGIDADERATMLRFGQSFGRGRIGAWLEEHDGRFATGWRVSDEVPIEALFELAPESEDAETLKAWATRETIVHGREIMRTVGDAQQTQWTMTTSLAAAERAFAALGVPWPKDVVARSIGVFPAAAYGLSVTLAEGAAVHIGLVSMRPPRQLVLATCDLVVSGNDPTRTVDENESDERLAAYELALGAKRPESIELALGPTFDVRVHLAAT